MATYAIGDVQGCYDELQALLDKIGPTSNDEIWFVGDLVNRGPKSLKTLRFIHQMGTQAKCVLGNHDLHLLAVANQTTKLRSGDTIEKLLNAKDASELLQWLGTQPLVHHDASNGFTMVHAGIPPQWNISDALSYSAEVQSSINSALSLQYFSNMYGNTPNKWSNKLVGFDRLRLITNYLTRMRFCTSKGRLDLQAKGTPEQCSEKLVPWYTLRNNPDEKLVFGHWSALGQGQHGQHRNMWSLDTGCVWGDRLTALQLGDQPLWHSVESSQQKVIFG